MLKTETPNGKKRICEVVQQERFLPREKIESVLDEWDQIRFYAFIRHDRDINEQGELKEPHWHILLKLKQSTDLKTVANQFDIEPQYVQKCKSGFNAALAYLTHENAPNKVPYEDEEVKANFAWTYDRDRYMKAVDAKLTTDHYCHMITAGQIKEYQLADEIPPDIFIKSRNQIMNALEYRKMIEAKSNDRNMEVVYITGGTGSGKTVYSKKYAKENDMAMFVSGASNDLYDGYKQEPLVCLDDLRPFMTVAEFIKMIDPYTSSSVKRRYSNVNLNGCKKMFITSILPIEVFVENLECKDEDLRQVMRRFSEIIEIKDGKAIHKKWDGEKIVDIYEEKYSPSDYFGGRDE